MKEKIAFFVAVVAAVAAFIPVAKWEYHRSLRKRGWHITNGIGSQKIQDFWTTNPTYVTVVWETNGVTVTSRIVTNRYK